MAVERLTPKRRRALTREHLLEAAQAVFARLGFHGASLDEIAAVAGFTKGAVYSNFKSKEDLFLAVLEERDEQQQAAFAAAVAEGSAGLTPDEGRPDVWSEEIVDLMSQQMRGNREWYVLFLEFALYAARNPAARAKLAAGARRNREVVEQIMQTQLDRSGVTSTIPVPTMATIALALFSGLDLAYLIDPDAVTQETLEAMIELLAFPWNMPDDAERTP